MPHTPGPWRIGIKGFNPAHIYAGKDDALEACGICTVSGVGLHGEVKNQKDDECFSNAHLIAAAPELLEACKLMAGTEKVMPEMKNNFLLGSILAHCKKAVEKAEGKA